MQEAEIWNLTFERFIILKSRIKDTVSLRSPADAGDTLCEERSEACGENWLTISQTIVV